jgi:hypothetical protein
MTRKDYIKFAELIKDSIYPIGAKRDKNTILHITEDLIELFREDNYRFDSEKFRKACNHYWTGQDWKIKMPE